MTIVRAQPGGAHAAIDLAWVSRPTITRIPGGGPGGHGVNPPVRTITTVGRGRSAAAATIYGRFCVDARTADGVSWELGTIAPDLGPPAPMIVTLPAA